LKRNSGGESVGSRMLPVFGHRIGLILCLICAILIRAGLAPA